MARPDRMQLMRDIESETSTRLLIYITGDRRGLETRIATDAFPLFHRLLQEMGRQQKISLFLYTTGGLTIAGYALVNLVREFCTTFDVLVPYKALSTGTLIALGADSVLMTPMGQLSPIDPSVEHPLGPMVQRPGQPGGSILPVNVEDVNAFLDLATRSFSLQGQQSLTTVFERLAGTIHPLVLGAVQRSREEIAFLASSLMKHHTKDKKKISRVVQTLIRERFSHNYIIGPTEAETALGLNIVRPTGRLLDLIIRLYNEYNELAMLDTPYNPEAVLGPSQSGVHSFNRGVIETTQHTYTFRTTKETSRIQVQQPGVPVPVIGYSERVLAEQWLLDDNL